MNSSNKLLYIGAGLHLDPTKHFESTKELVFVDIQPRTEFDINNNFDEVFYRKNFYSGLIMMAKEFDFVLEKSVELDPDYHMNISSIAQRVKWKDKVKELYPFICPTLLVFSNSNTGQKLKYYISTNILSNMCMELLNDIKTSDGLIISGYHPEKDLLNYITNPINLYCYTGTCYKLDDDEVDNYNNLVYWMFNNLNKISTYFSNIFLVDRDEGTIVKYNDIIRLDKDVNKIHRRKFLFDD